MIGYIFSISSIIKRIMSKLAEKLNVFDALEKLFNPKPPACGGLMVSDAKIVIRAAGFKD